MLYLPEIASRTFSKRINRYKHLGQLGWAVLLEESKEVILLDNRLNETDRINLEQWHPSGYKYHYWFDLYTSPDGQHIVLSAKDQVIILDRQGQLHHRTTYPDNEFVDHIRFVFTQDGLMWSVNRTPDHQTGYVITLMDLPARRVVAQHTINTPHSGCYLCTHPFATEVFAVIIDHCAINDGSQLYRVKWDGATLSLMEYGVDYGAIYEVAPSAHEFVALLYEEDGLAFHDFKTGHLISKCYLDYLRPASEADHKDEALHINNISYLDDWRCLIEVETHQHYEYWLLDRINLALIQQIQPTRHLPYIQNLRQLWQQKDFTLPEEPWVSNIVKGTTGELLCEWSDNTLQLVDSQQLLFPNFSGPNAPIPNYQLSLFDHEN